jgi:hypothetical protein
MQTIKMALAKGYESIIMARKCSALNRTSYGEIIRAFYAK